MDLKFHTYSLSEKFVTQTNLQRLQEILKNEHIKFNSITAFINHFLCITHCAQFCDV